MEGQCVKEKERIKEWGWKGGGKFWKRRKKFIQRFFELKILGIEFFLKTSFT